MKVEENNDTVERWEIFEISMKGPKDGNPFLDIGLSTKFKLDDQTLEPEGFYDGDGIYRVRFMPNEVGDWTYETVSNSDELNGITGNFTCIKPSLENHGPVRVYDTFYFHYADGIPYHQFGTTCYAWVHQGEELEEQTLKTLASSLFNKLRMCVFPKDYVYNKNEPEYYPFEGKSLKDWDFTRFNPEFWRHFEGRVDDLRRLGIEADIILFHPYDRWGFATMDSEVDERYLRYIVARLAAYRNIWWSMANEYDLMKEKTMDDWDRFLQIVQEFDPYNHLRSIHNCRQWYDHKKSWVTHASIQEHNLKQGREVRDKYQKPVIFDEVGYEGNISQGWGNLTAKQMVRRFWIGTMTGCYVGHGETYKHPDDILWWSKGGVLHGDSPRRIVFLKELMSNAPPFEELKPLGDDKEHFILAKPGEYYLVYFLNPQTITLELDGDKPYKVESIDPWGLKETFIETTQPGEYTFSSEKSDFVYRFTS